MSKLYKTKFLPFSIFSYKIELVENEDILHGYFTGKKTWLKTHELFLKMYDRIKKIQSYKIFSKTCLLHWQ